MLGQRADKQACICQGFGLRVFWPRVSKVSGSGFRVSGLGFRVQD